MPKWIDRIMGKGIADSAEKIGNMVERVGAGHLGKKELRLELEKLLAADRERASAEIVTEIAAKERILVAELQQSDAYTKRARPTIVYVGLLASIADGIGYIDFTMPDQFWPVWAGVAGLWVIGRSAEKVKVNGTAGKVAAAITGGPSASILEG